MITFCFCIVLFCFCNISRHFNSIFMIQVDLCSFVLCVCVCGEKVWGRSAKYNLLGTWDAISIYCILSHLFSVELFAKPLIFRFRFYIICSYCFGLNPCFILDISRRKKWIAHKMNVLKCVCVWIVKTKWCKWSRAFNQNWN